MHHAHAAWPGPTKDTLQAANFFAKALFSTSGVGNGPLSLCWRLLHDPVGNIIKPVKPHVITKQRISLPAGKPVRVAWPADA
jgi:hypothetical protein